MSIRTKQLPTLKVAQLRKLAVLHDLSPKQTKEALASLLIQPVRRDAQASAYLERARSYFRVEVVGKFVVTFAGAIGGRGFRKERSCASNAKAHALAARLIESKKKQGFRAHSGENKRKAESFDADVLPKPKPIIKKKKVAGKKDNASSTGAKKTAGAKKTTGAKTAGAKKKKTVATKTAAKRKSATGQAPSAKRAKKAASAAPFQLIFGGIAAPPAASTPTLGTVNSECTIPNGIVLNVGNEIYDCSLNQINLATNTDKYYNIQVIQTPTEFYTFTHWGRTGSKGQNQTFGPFTTQQEAIDVFHDKYKEKTGQDWTDRANFQQQADKYNLLNKSYAKRVVGKWQYYMHAPQDGKAVGWYDYDSAASDIVENVYENFESNPTLGIRVVQSGMWMYQVDLAKMTQTNVQHSAHTVRQIRRVVV